MLRPRATWCALLSLLLLPALVGCGGGGKKKVDPKKSSSRGKKKPKKPSSKGKKKPTPKVVKSKSGKTARELVDALGESFKEVDATQGADDLAAGEVKRVRIVGELIDMGAGALSPVLNALRHPVPEVREWACVILGEYGKSEAANDLLAIALNDRDRNLAVFACDALGRIDGIAGAMKKLEPRLTVQSFQAGHHLWDTQAGLLRNAAAEALARAGNKEAVPALIKNLEGAGAEVRRDALVRLRRVTGQAIALPVDAPPSDRKRGIDKWNQWWESNKGLFRAAPREGREIHAVFAAKK